MSFPRIETARLSLQPFTRDDADSLHRMWTEPAVRKYLWDDVVIPHETAVEVVQSSLDSFAEHGFGYWTVCLKDTAEQIGFCGLRHFQEDGVDDQEVEILYGLDPKHWGNGYATEAANAVLRFGFEQLGLERIFAGADPPNQDSFRVIERLGMTFSRHTKVGGLEAIYYMIGRHEFRADDAAFQIISGSPV